MTTTLIAPAARADEGVTCTLQRSIKVKVGGAFVPVDAGAKVKVKVRKAEWSTVDTPLGAGVTATKVLEQTCKPLPPRPPEPAAGVEKPAKPPKAEKPPKVAKVVPPKPPKAEKPPKPPKVVKAKPVNPAKPVKGKKGAPVAPVEPAETDIPVEVAAAPVPPVAPVPVVVAVPPPSTPAPTAVVVAPTLDDEAPTAPTPAPEAVQTASTLKAVRVAVRQLTVDAAALDESDRLDVIATAALEHELAKLTGVSIIDIEKDVVRLGDDGSARLRACADDACVANIASSLGADELVIGAVTSTARGLQLEARRLTVLPLAPLASYTGSAADDEGTVRLVGAAADALFAERQRRDGAAIGPSTELVARLDPPPVAPVVTIAVGSAAVVGVGVAVVATVFNQLAYNEGQQIAAASSAATPANGAQLAAIDGTVKTSFVALTAAGISAAALAVGAGVLAIFTDWQDLSGEPPAATPTETTAPPLTTDAP